MKTYIRFKQIISKVTLTLACLIVTQNSFAALVLDQTGKSSKSTYVVEVRKEGDSYSAIISEVIKPGQTEVIYESSSLSKINAKNQTKYSDERMTITEGPNGKSTLILDNGEKIQVELGG